VIERGDGRGWQFTVKACLALCLFRQVAFMRLSHFDGVFAKLGGNPVRERREKHRVCIAGGKVT
jgi:hypothetical protein